MFRVMVLVFMVLSVAWALQMPSICVQRIVRWGTMEYEDKIQITVVWNRQFFTGIAWVVSSVSIFHEFIDTLQPIRTECSPRPWYDSSLQDSGNKSWRINYCIKSRFICRILLLLQRMWNRSFGYDVDLNES